MSINNKDGDAGFPQNEEMYKEISNKLDAAGLNSDSLITIIKELARLSRQANHEQIHILIQLMDIVLASLVFAHQIIAMREGESHE